MTKYIEPKISKDELQQIFEMVYQNPDSVPIIDKAAELCTRIHIKTEDPILFVTDRTIQWATETHELVQRFCRVPYLIAFNNGYGKLPYLNGITYFVEDRAKTIMELSAAGKAVFVPMRDWNLDIKDNRDSVVYIKDIHELLKHINMIVK